MGLPWWLSSQEPTCNAGDAGDAGSVPGLGRSPGGGHGNLLQYSCLENPMDRGAWRATIHRVAKNRTRLKWLSTFACVVWRAASWLRGQIISDTERPWEIYLSARNLYFLMYQMRVSALSTQESICSDNRYGSNVLVKCQTDEVLINIIMLDPGIYSL